MREYLAILEAPDPDSQTPEEDGRRIVRLDPDRAWGWRVVNIQMYRGMGDLERIRKQTRERVQKHRLRAVDDSGSKKWTTDDAQVVRHVLNVLAPKIQVESGNIAAWFTIAAGDPWRLCAALCEVAVPLRRARSTAYVTRILRNATLELTGEEAREYVEATLRSVERQVREGKLAKG